MRKICIYTRFELSTTIYVVATIQVIWIEIDTYLVSVSYYEAPQSWKSTTDDSTQSSTGILLYCCVP